MELKPRVRLIKEANIEELAVSSARSCYSPDIKNPETLEEEDKKLLRGIVNAGHTTTLQHTHLTFLLENISRFLTHDALNAHPFYNSEQQSQRYAKLSRDGIIIPTFRQNESAQRYREIAEEAFTTFEDLTTILTPIAEEELNERFKNKNNKAAAKKKAQEVARYVLPLGMGTHMYHTLSVLDLLRLSRTRNSSGCPTELGALVDMMIEEAGLSDVLRDQAAQVPFEKTPLGLLGYGSLEEFSRDKSLIKKRKEFNKLFDSLVGEARTLPATPETIARLGIEASQYENMLLLSGIMCALGIMDGSLEHIEKNPFYLDTINSAPFDKIGRATMLSPNFAFFTKLSHTADSQNQRHRRTPGVRPYLLLDLTLDPDYIIPEMIRKDDGAREIFESFMKKLWGAIRTLYDNGENPEFIQYLMPNAKTVRILESGDLHGFSHKIKMRTCLNAQEEIWRLAVRQYRAVIDRSPSMANLLGAPCQLRLRKNDRPYCPEGPRYCGIKLWTENGIPESLLESRVI